MGGGGDGVVGAKGGRREELGQSGYGWRSVMGS
jgi:hypothetical protein